MAAPSAELDGYEFAELMATHLLVTGNAYIEKVRKSDDPLRRATPYRVKELGLIRPDYVTIRPGSRRADDVFVITVQGAEVKRLKRADVVHIKLANPANDFYGLSPLEVLAREVNLDAQLTEFDLAFFRNAGVPMGLLKTKSRMSPDEIASAKSAFRRSFSGLRRWFEVMVLNADEAEYQPLGGMPKDMEMGTTRELAESRICAVFGIPPIIVGANVGLQHSTYSNYEQAQASFWSETMKPFASMVSSAITRELLPEFATTQDRGGRVEYSFADVQALQEDHSARLASVVAMIGTGAFTVNEALTLHRLPALDAGDFYVRNLTQVIDVALPQESVQQVTAPGQTLDDVRPAEARGRREIAGKASDPRRQRERLGERTQRALATFFAEQADRVVSRLPLKGRKALADDLIPESEIAELLDVLRPYILQGVEIGWETAAGAIGADPAFPATDPRVLRFLETAGERVVGITEETRLQVVRALEIARAEGLSIGQVSEMLRDLPAFNASRAELVARTELAMADNAGAIERYESSGLVSEVDIIDGPECGWESHDDPDLAAGSRRSLAEWRAHVISHPNCVRSAAPVIRR